MTGMLGVIEWLGSWATIAVLLHFAIQIGISVRVVMNRNGVGEIFAWVILVMLIPVVGAILYLLIGELRLGTGRSRRIASLVQPVRQRLHALDPYGRLIVWSELGLDCQQLARSGRNLFHVPALPGNETRLFDDWNKIFDQLVQDIDSAQINCDMEFYIWSPGGRIDEIVAALERAAARGVVCRIQLDSLGSRPFLSSAAAEQLRKAGVRIQAALPGGLWRLPFVRFDLRMHRKIVVIDDRIGWTGSLNLVDPRYFKQYAGVGQWVDAMVRIRGPAVEAMAIVFQADWQIESGSNGNELPDLTGNQPIEHAGDRTIQVLSSGPAFSIEAIEQILITAIYSAREELIITTPYFVPGEPLSMALASAARRGVAVTVILPARNDSRLVQYASRVLKGRLLDAGVRIALFDGGLLHTKSVTIDGRISLFGSMNLDPRSLRLNFEITLAIFNASFTCELVALQKSYLQNSTYIDPEEWNRRPVYSRFAEKLAHLLSPLL